MPQPFEGPTADLRVSRRLVGSGLATSRECVPWSRAKTFIANVEFVFLTACLEEGKADFPFSSLSDLAATV
jgi:hypothetical protein